MPNHSHFFCLIAAFLFCASSVFAKLGGGLEGLTKSNTQLINKRVERKVWQSKENADMMKKSFPIQEWDKHFSSVGSKRSPISLKEDRDKKIFKTNTKEFPTKEFNMAGWNEEFVDLHTNAQISTDDKARKIADRKLYQMMMRDAKNYSELGENVSLRDINKYQFRRNRSSDEVPVETIGNR
ncbi:MAG: hypothetical protein ACN4GF_00470 [Lentimonas sp.]